MNRRSFGLVLASASALVSLPARHARAASTAVSLFVIERSMNANVVHYDGRLAADGGALDTKEPVIAYWIMRAEDGRREGLTLLERRLAFGFDVVPGPNAGTYTMRIVAFRERGLTLTRASGRWRAVAAINGKPSYLNRIYVKTAQDGVLPKVVFVDLFGEDESGRPVQERLVNARA